MKTTQITYKWLLPALSLLLVSFQVHALALSQANLTATTDDNSNLASLGEINTALNSSYQDLALLWKSQTDKGMHGELKDSYLWHFDPSVNSGTIDHIPGRAAADCTHCILIAKLGDSSPAQYLYDLGSWDGREQIALSGFRSDKEDDIANVAIWAGLKHTTEPGVLMLMSLGILGLVFSGKRKGV